jgi:hypothetical protein
MIIIVVMVVVMVLIVGADISAMAVMVVAE